MPKTAARPAGRNPGGRPKLPGPRKTITVRLDQDLVDWFYANIPRPKSLSSYLNEAFRERVNRARR